MTTGLLIFHIIVVLAMIGIILLQRNEGGGLGMGSSNMGGFMTTRGTANLLTRTTAVLATGFFITTLVLALLFKGTHNTKSILEEEDNLKVEHTTPVDNVSPNSMPNSINTNNAPVPTPSEQTPSSPLIKTPKGTQQSTAKKAVIVKPSKTVPTQKQPLKNTQ